MKKGLFSLAAALASRAGLAFAQNGPPVWSDGPGFKDLAWAGGSLILVLAAMILALKGLQRLGRGRAGRRGEKFFESRGFYPLDNRKYLAAVAVDGRLLIIGVTPDRLTCLGRWPLRREQPAGPKAETPPAEDGPPDISVFEEALK